MKAIALIAFAVFTLLTQPWIRSPDTPTVATLVVAPQDPGYTGAALMAAPYDNTVTAFVEATSDAGAVLNTACIHEDPGRNVGVNINILGFGSVVMLLEDSSALRASEHTV